MVHGDADESGSLYDVTSDTTMSVAPGGSERLIAVATRDAERFAHGFNNVLTAIVTCTELAIDQMPADAPARHELERILEATDRAGGLIRELRELPLRLAAASAADGQARPLDPEPVTDAQG